MSHTRPHKGSLRAVAALRRLRQEQETLRILRAAIRKDRAGVWRTVEGWFVSDRDVEENHDRQKKCQTLIGDIGARLRKLGVRT